MPIALTEEHRELADVAADFLADRDVPGALHAACSTPTRSRSRRSGTSSSSMGWLGLHLPEEFGGSGYGLTELAVVVEALGAACAPGPFLPTVIASAIIDALGTDAQRERHLPGFADGTTLGATALAGSCEMNADGYLAGDTGLVLGGGPRHDARRAARRRPGDRARVPR